MEEKLLDYVLEKLNKADAPKSEAARYESDEINELGAALAKAQGKMSFAKMDSVNPHFKSRYADLGSIIAACREPLASHGLAVIQRVLPSSHGLYLFTRLVHESGQWIESRMPINPPREDIQSLGSYLTYLRRYSYGAMVGVVGGEDDDGETAMRAQETQSRQDERSHLITKEQLKILSLVLGQRDPVVRESILQKLKIEKLSDMPAKKYTEVLNWVREKPEVT